jgi:hypothetical protein
LKIHSFDACLGHVLPFYHSFLWRNFCGFAGVGVATITATRSMRNLWERDSQPHCIGNLRDLRRLKSSRLELGYQGTFGITERNWALRFDTLCPRPSEVRVI